MPNPTTGLGSAVPFFSTETKRMLRDDWDSQGIEVLAQETYALLQLLRNYQSDGSANYYQQGEDAPVNIFQPITVPNSPAITITRYDPFTTGGVPPLPGSPGIVDTLTIGPDGILQNGEPIAADPTVQQITGDDQLAPITLVGTIVSGTGSSYSVRVYGNGSNVAGATEGTIINATQLQIASDAQIPSGTSVTAIGYPYGATNAAGIRPVRWFLNVPVWL
jgi:hypothetical protein